MKKLVLFVLAVVILAFATAQDAHAQYYYYSPCYAYNTSSAVNCAINSVVQGVAVRQEVKAQKEIARQQAIIETNRQNAQIVMHGQDIKARQFEAALASNRTPQNVREMKAAIYGGPDDHSQIKVAVRNYEGYPVTFYVAGIAMKIPAGQEISFPWPEDREFSPTVQCKEGGTRAVPTGTMNTGKKVGAITHQLLHGCTPE